MKIPQALFYLLSLLFLFSPGDCPVYSASLSLEEKFEEGISLYKKGQYAGAVNAFQKLEEEAGENRLKPDVAFMQGLVFRAMENWPEAERAFSRAAEIHPVIPDYAVFYQGEALQKMGESQKSIASCERLAAVYPQSLLVPQAQLRAAELYFQQRDFAKTLETSEQLLKGKAWKDSSARARLLVAESREGLDQWPEAVKAYQDFWLKHPLHAGAPKARSRWESLSVEKGFSPGAIPPESLLQRALLIFQANSFEAALAEFNRMEGCPSQAFPENYKGEPWTDELYFHRGMCYFRLKQYPKAVETFDLVIRNSRSAAAGEKSLFWMFQALIRSSRYEEALDAFARFQASYPQSSFTAQGLYLKAAVYEEMGERDKAVSSYRETAEKYPRSPQKPAALWSAGWVLYQKRDYPGAVREWDRLQESAPPVRWLEKALYWKSRALEKAGQTAKGEENRARLLKDFPHSYYSGLAPDGRSPANGLKGRYPALMDRSLSPIAELKTVRLEKGRLLVRLNLLSMAAAELEGAEEEAGNGDEVWLEISRIYREAEEYYRSNLLVRRKLNFKPLSERLSEREKIAYLLAYPVGDASLINRYAQERNLDPALLCALILEESRFQAGAVSAAGARGLMQLVPVTAQKVARELKIQRVSGDQLFDPGMNVRLGSWYLAKMLEEFGGKTHLALAAYNAGPHMVRKWLAGCRSKSEDEFVESIPYSETRNYVIRVITSARIYRALYRPPGKPTKP